jgi:tetratricopeptide (TPR) repeat protein
MSSAARTKFTWGASAAIPLLFLAIIPLQVGIDRCRSQMGAPEELWLRSGKLLKTISMGYDSLLADIYWTRAIQYYGSQFETGDSKFTELYPLMSIALTLDPRLTVVPRGGSILLSEPNPVGAGRPDQAVELLQQAIAAKRDDWQLYASLGFVYYWYMKDYGHASQVYLQGGQYSGAPIWMKGMAARIAELGGSRETSVMVWSEIYQTSSEPRARENARQHLEALHAQADIEELQKIVDNYRGHILRLTSLRDLVEDRVLPDVPVDPAGFAYVLDSSRVVGLNPSSTVRLDILELTKHDTAAK